MLAVVIRPAAKVKTAVSSFGGALRALRTERHLSLAALGDATAYDRSAIANIEAGRRMPDRRFAAMADRHLAADGRLVGAWDRDAADRDAAREQRHLLQAAEAESLALAAELATVDLTGEQAAQLAVDYLAETPAEMLRRTLAARSTAVALLHRGGHAPGSHADLLLAVGQLSGVLAYASLDLGHSAQALNHTFAAWRCAELAGDHELRAWVRGTQALIARFDEDFSQALWFARDGMQYATTGPSAARLLCGQAQSMTGLGDSAGTVVALQQAESAREQILGDDSAAGIFAFREAKQRYYAGSSLIWNDDTKLLARAEHESLAAIHGWETGPVDERSLSDEALCRVYAATARVNLGEVDGAREALGPILDLPEDRRISWIQKRMARVAHLLGDAPYDKSPLASSLRDELIAY